MILIVNLPFYVQHVCFELLVPIRMHQMCVNDFSIEKFSNHVRFIFFTSNAVISVKWKSFMQHVHACLCVYALWKYILIWNDSQIASYLNKQRNNKEQIRSRDLKMDLMQQEFFRQKNVATIFFSLFHDCHLMMRMTPRYQSHFNASLSSVTFN